MQSGLHRLSYGLAKAHEGAVVGVVCDKLNQLVVTGSIDNLVKVWSFKAGTLLEEINLKAKIVKVVINREK